MLSAQILPYSYPIITLSLPKLTVWICLYYSLYWFDLRNRLNMTKTCKQGQITPIRTNKHFKLFNGRGYNNGYVRILL